MAARADKLWMVCVACGLVVVALGLAFDASPYLGGVLLAQMALFGWANERLSHAPLESTRAD
jgi:hypothetical protein